LENRIELPYLSASIYIGASKHLPYLSLTIYLKEDVQESI